MNYLLDTNIIIDHLRGKKPVPKLVSSHQMTVSIITLGELLYGAHKSKNPKKTVAIVRNFIDEFALTIISIDEDSIVEFARLKANLETKGKRLEDFDLLIAATAVSNKLILVTRDVNHFKRIKNLVLFEGN